MTFGYNNNQFHCSSTCDTQTTLNNYNVKKNTIGRKDFNKKGGLAFTYEAKATIRPSWVAAQSQNQYIASRERTHVLCHPKAIAMTISNSGMEFFVCSSRESLVYGDSSLNGTVR